MMMMLMMMMMMSDTHNRRKKDQVYRLSYSTVPRPAAPHNRPERSWYVVSSMKKWEDREGSRTCTASASRRRARSRSVHRIHRCRKLSACCLPERWRSRSCDLSEKTIDIQHIASSRMTQAEQQHNNYQWYATKVTIVVTFTLSWHNSNLL